MKTIKLMFIGLLVTNFIFFYFILHKINNIESRLYDLSKDTISIEDTAYKITYNYILPKITNYNGNADTNAIKCMAKVMHHYNLDKTKKTTNMFVGQILQESSFNQYYSSGPLMGRLVVSSGGAIGMSQIMPHTAYCYMSKIISKKDVKEMSLLGCTDFSFIKTNTGANKLDKIKKWLTKKENNLILWGYIVHDMFIKNHDVNKTLVGYNAGLGGLKSYLDSGNVLTDHEYIVGIKNKVAMINGF